jgi:pimeloyl-ACP methyl ester carboxylesterase
MNGLLPPLSEDQLAGFKAPTFLVAAENDLFFPAKKVIPRSKQLLPNVTETMLLKGSTHYPLPAYLEKINRRIHAFLQSGGG